jgi:hypothetical protein
MVIFHSYVNLTEGMFYFIIKGNLDPTISGEVDLDAGRYSVECADGRQIRVRCENALC